MPMRGTPDRSSSTPCWRATQLMRVETSRPSKLGLSTSASPADFPNPRGSQVSTLKPPCQSAPMLNAPWMPACEVSVAPDAPHPGPISTGGRTWPPADGSGNQWTRILVPSNDVTSTSDGDPLTAVAVVERQLAGG